MTTATPRARVLVVDDDAQLLELLVDTLTSIGYAATPAHGGIKALEQLKATPFDIMVTDVKMPDLDGLQLLKKVRRHYPDMPVLFITGVASTEMIIQAAPDGFLAKPFRITHIEELIENTLHQRRLDRSIHGMRKVLIVDQDDDMRHALTEALGYSNFVPFSASGEQEARRELDNGTFHVVIADLDLALARTIKTESPATAVILMGPGGDPPAELPTQTYDAYLQKPFQAGTVVAMLNRLSPLRTPR